MTKVWPRTKALLPSWQRVGHFSPKNNHLHSLEGVLTINGCTR